MMDDTTKLSIEWDTGAGLWNFSAHRAGVTWAWTITPQEFKRMVSTLADMDDEFDQRLGAQIRSTINKKDEL